MAKTRTFISAAASVTAVAGTMIVGAVGAQATARPGDTPLAGSAVPFASHARVLGAVPGNSPLTVQLWLAPREAAAAAYASAVSTPGSAHYGQYLSPQAYTARFGASAAQVNSVKSWLSAQHFTGITVDAGRDYVSATAPAAKINAAFKITLNTYQSSRSVNAGPYALRGYSGSVSVPAALAGSVLGVTGLVNTAPVLTMNRVVTGTAAGNPCSRWYGEHFAQNEPLKYGRHSFPTVNCGYSGQQMRQVYGANSRLTGKGQTIALVELGLTQDMFLTLQDYAKANNVRPPSPARYRQVKLGANTCGDPFDVEEQLDVEASYVMAPDASQVVVGGDSCNNGNFGLQGLFNADIAVLNGNHGHPLARVASNSWESGDEGQPGYLSEIEHGYLVRAAAEGVGMYFSSGDASGVNEPSSDPFATAVGGTTLGISKAGKRLFETGWSTGISVDVKNQWVFQGEQSADGGGPSILWAQPRYQRGVVPNRLAHAPGNRGGLVRSVPDISAVGDPFTGFAVGLLVFNSQGQPTSFTETPIGGTSLAAPLVGGMVIAAQQGHRPFGFINPLLYGLYRHHRSAYFDDQPITSRTPVEFRAVECDASLCGATALTTFDDQSFTMNGYTGQVTLRGYDNMTGVGTPNGQTFLSLLRRFGA